ncbi:MAG: DUF4434 domain-containing protein [Clostridia bacterium]|nr:DUF4434 domain-containing protein [Clostridia bacterium]MBR4799130.1 DUF4434 domain-containing protein [Clostridia bacterium]
MLKPINGTWFEFWHHNRPEGKYWNPIITGFSDEQWEEKVGEIASLGMKYIVLLTTAQVYENEAWAYFKTDIYPFADMAAKDPMGALLRAAEKHGIKVFVSCGFYGTWNQTENNMTSPEVQKRAFRAMEQLYAQYGKYKSFYGWYLPDELGIWPYYPDSFIKYVNEYAAFGRGLNAEHKILIAPYGTNHAKTDDNFVRQLEAMDADIIAYQDEIGVRKSKPEETAEYYANLRKAHDKAGRGALWADMEVFEFEGDVYRSALIPAEMSRIERQMQSISPYVDEILIYQYQGMFNKPGTKAFCGHPDSIKLYNDYVEFLKRNK